MDLQRPDGDDVPSSIEKSNDDELPQCKIKRNYSCNHCTYFTQNPRFYLTHLRDIHGERIVINKCNLCLYASRHYQKLVRHMKMVHGSTEGIVGQSRKRPPVEDNPWNQLQKKIPTSTLVFPTETCTNLANLPNDLELSRKSLKDIAALYFAENQIDTIMTQMEEADAVQLPQPPPDLQVPIKRKASGSTFFDEIKKSFVEEENLTCNCGHVSKCFSESVIHRKSCSYLDDGKPKNELPAMNLTSGSTRCQQCRRRCKSSADLLKHLQNCSRTEPSVSEASALMVSKEPNVNDDSSTSILWNKPSTSSDSVVLVDDDQIKHESVEVEPNFETHQRSGEDSQDKSYSDSTTAAGCGEVPNKKTEEEPTSSSLKKVFKCPCCSFWASTASRFHVHIVGHLNKKPFKCSLCAYRSNWRWDITKHIRIKTIRNPNHKNARVIMNDGAERRNYTKYNKYITLMKVTDEDGDPKQIRCGEMTPNQEASLAFLNDFNKEVSTSEQLNQKKDSTDSLFKQEAPQTQTGIKRSTPPLFRTSEGLIRNVKTEGLEKKTFYNCRKCHFRHANRDAVLAHVKIHHQSAGCLPSSNLGTPIQAAQADDNSSIKPNMNEDFAAALCLSPKHLLEEKTTHNDKNNNQHVILSHCDKVESTVESLLKPDSSSKEILDDLNLDKHSEVAETNSSILPNNPTAISITPISSPSTSVTDRTKSFIRNAGKSAMSIAVTRNTNFINDSNDRREPSPFRCGHCHQVSNWKHVIQRHCRLKHSGQIQIEAFDRSSDGRAPVYRPLDFYASGSLRHTLGSSADDCESGAIKAPQQQQQQQTHSISNKTQSKNKIEHSLQSPPTSSTAEADPETTCSLDKQFKCPSCPYISEDKLQLNFHISLHKSMQYKCNQCSYICTKKQHLTCHVKAHDKTTIVDVKDQKKSPDEEQPAAVLAVKVVSHCPICPEVFINNAKKLQQHLKAHGANYDLKCDVCDFSTKQKATLLSHSFAHTSTYQEKAELISKDGKEDVEYPAQKIHQITPSSGDSPAWVVADSQKNPQLETEANVESSTSDSNTGVSQKCSYCPFQTVCHKSLQYHLQYHIRVSKRPEKHTCEHCDFSTSSKINLVEHTRIHFDSIDLKTSTSFCTSNESLNPIVTESGDKMPEQHSPNNKVDPKSDSKITERTEKTDKDINSKRQKSIRTTPLKDEKKSSQPPSSHKTILVNPKTGQVIKRN